jgi:chromate transporter
LAFGGGPGIQAALEDELVRRRRVVTPEDFLTTYALARIAPAGTSTSLAVAYGHRFGGMTGTLLALAGLLLPSVTLTLLLTLSYASLAGGPVLPVLSAAILPAALAFMVLAALRLGREVYRPSLDLALAAGALAAALAFRPHPAIVLLAGGLAGMIFLRPAAEKRP